jgi:hypothetical protein
MILICQTSPVLKHECLIYSYSHLIRGLYGLIATTSQMIDL